MSSAPASIPDPVPPWGAWRGYAIATASTSATIGARVLLEPALGPQLTFLLAYPAVMVAALWGGLGPTVLSTALSIVAAVSLTEGPLASAGVLVRVAVFGGTSVLLGAMAEWLARARRQAITATAAELRAQRAATALQDRLRLTVDSAPGLICYVGADYRYRLVNRAYEAWFARPPADIEGRHVREVVGESAWERVRPHMERALRGEVVRYEEALPYEHGTRWVEVRYTPEIDPEGNTVGLVATVDDISERKRGELALMQRIEQSERKRALITALSETLTYAQVARAVIDHVLAMTGAHAGTLAVLSDDGATVELLDSEGYGPEILAVWRRFPIDADVPMAEAVRSGQPVFLPTAEERARRYPALAASVAQQSLGASASVPLQMLGRTIGVLGLTWSEARELGEEERTLLHGVAAHCAQALERARLYDAEHRARQQAEAASRAKDEFLAMLGHELRNPLAPIVTAVELMKMRGDRGSERERIVVERQARHLVQLVDDLLDVARIARGKLELKRGPLDVRQSIARAIELASPLLEQRQHRLEVQLPDEDLHVAGDATRLAQVFANLLTNAARYTDAGGQVVISAAREGSAIVVRVRDTGIGIAPELLPHVFELFVQGTRRLEQSRGGLGLGLAIVKSLVALHDGEVSAHSAGPGHGTEVVVRLPRLETVAEAARDGGPDSGVRPRGRRVLVVDDNVDAAEMLSELLARMGHETRIADDGPSALAALATFQPDVAVLDLGMPVMDGYELAQRMRATARANALRTPRLVAVTGYGQPSDRARTRAAGFDAHLVKPVALPELLEAIRPGDVGRIVSAD